MGEKITGYDGEVIAEIVDHHDSSGKYLGTAFVEEKDCLELTLWLFLLYKFFICQLYGAGNWTHG